MGYDWDFSGVLHYFPAFMRALKVTIALTLFSSLIGTLVGVPIAFVMRLPRLISVPFSFLVDAIRAIPNLVLIFFFYYFPYKDLLGVQPISPFWASAIALAVAQAAYSGDVFRAAVDQVPRSQILGLQALGFDKSSITRYVTTPSIIRQTFPVHVAFWIGNLKLSSLASVIGTRDIVFVAKVSMAQTFRSLEAWLFVALLYVMLVLPLAYILRYLERTAWMRRQ